MLENFPALRGCQSNSRVLMGGCRACHTTLISEAEHFFIFRLQLETEVAKIKTILPRKYLSEIYTLPEYHCFYTDNAGIVKAIAPIKL